MKYFTLLPLFYTLLLPSIAYSLDIEEDNNKDIGLATVWAIGQITDGGYLKTGIYSSPMYNELPVFWEFEGGWRVADRFTFGMNLRPSLSEVRETESSIVMIGLVFGYRGFLPIGLPYLIDIKLGTIDTMKSNKSHWFIEPNFNLIKKSWSIRGRSLIWTAGLSYRYVQRDTGDNTAKELSGPGLNIMIAMGKY